MSNEYFDWLNDLKNAPEDSADHNHWLCLMFPWLIPHNHLTGKIIKDFDYTWTELDNMPVGWRKTFGEQMCFEIKKLLEEANYQYNYEILQIKEKWGKLCWYDNGVPENIYDNFQEIIHKYEDLSKKTCTLCGEEASKTTDDWFIPICNNCYDEFENRKKFEK